MHTWHDKVRLPPSSLSASALALFAIPYSFLYGGLSLRVFEQRCCARKSLRVPVLQFEAQR